jgi:hypothetical protein
MDISKLNDDEKRKAFSLVIDGCAKMVEKAMLDLGFVADARAMSVALTIDVHGTPMAGTVIKGNPQRIARHFIEGMMSVKDQDEDFDSIGDLLGIRDHSTGCPTNQIFVDFAVEMTQAANMIIDCGVNSKADVDRPEQ